MPEVFDSELRDYLRRIDEEESRADDIDEDLRKQHKQLDRHEFELWADGVYIGTFTDINEAFMIALQFDEGDTSFELKETTE